MKLLFTILISCCFLIQGAFAQQYYHRVPQSPKKHSFFTPSDTLNTKRLWLLSGSTAVGYTGVVLALDQIWYKGYPRSKFQFFNDMGEWEDMDKFGHIYTAYMESALATKAFRWTGLNRNQSAWLGFGASVLFQTTLETLDGFSAKWGWSWGDIGFNTAGSLLFLTQELAWKEQRIVMKYSSWQRPTKGDVTSIDGMHTIPLSKRKGALYGTGFFEGLIKDYNSSTMWLSANIHSFIPDNECSEFPKWLNIAVGHGAENLYGGFSNTWTDEDTGASYNVNESHKRYRQIFLSVDVDLTRIKTRNKFLKSLFSVINVFKIPAPTVEFTTTGKVKFHPIYF